LALEPFSTMACSLPAPGHTVVGLSNVSYMGQLDHLIRAAQLEAVKRHPHGDYSRALESGKHVDRPGNWEPMTTNSGPLQLMEPTQLLGCWTDSYGNSVSVTWADPNRGRLAAVLSRPPRPAIHLNLQREQDGHGWHCGDATLDHSSSSGGQIWWIFPNGRVSVWTRVEQENDAKPQVALQTPQYNQQIPYQQQEQQQQLQQQPQHQQLQQLQEVQQQSPSVWVPVLVPF